MSGCSGTLYDSGGEDGNYVDAKIYESLLQFSDFHCRLTMETEERDYADEIIERILNSVELITLEEEEQ